MKLRIIGRRGKRLARATAGTLVVVMLGLSAAAGFHTGDHDDLGWLPPRFHHHHYRLAAESAGAPLPLVDHCLGCQVSRTIVRLASALPGVPVRSVAIAVVPAPGPDAPRARFAHPSSPRAPPAS